MEVEKHCCGETQFHITENITLITFEGEDYIDIMDWANDEGVTLSKSEFKSISNLLEKIQNK